MTTAFDLIYERMFGPISTDKAVTFPEDFNTLQTIDIIVTTKNMRFRKGISVTTLAN
jgi:hypothetical protein